MRSLLTGALALGLVTFVASPAFGGAIEVNFDENGNGTWLDTTGSPFFAGATSGTLAFALAADPTGSVGGNVLIYLLPELVISGPVDVGEPGDLVRSTDTNPSDVVFFTDSGGVNDHGLDANLMIFYSQAGGGALADSGLPPIPIFYAPEALAPLGLWPASLLFRPTCTRAPAALRH